MDRAVEIYSDVVSGYTLGDSGALCAVNSLALDLSSFYFGVPFNLYLEAKFESPERLSYVSASLRRSSADTGSGTIMSEVQSSSLYGSAFRNINADEWVGIRIPSSMFSVVSTYVPSSMAYFEFYSQVHSGNAGNLQVRRIFLEYGETVETNAPFSICASGGGESLKIYPERNLSLDLGRLDVIMRLTNTSLFTYKYVDYRRFNLEANYVPASVGDAVNSLWENKAPCVFFAAYSHGAIIQPVKFTNSTSPFAKYEPGYYKTLMTGKIELEGS